MKKEKFYKKSDCKEKHVDESCTEKVCEDENCTIENDNSCDEKEQSNSCENEKIINLEKKVDELTDKYYRANADFENIKKRLEKEKLTAVAYASESFAKDILPVIDALEAALSIDTQGDDLASKIKDGVKQCLDMMLKSLEKQGIKQVETDGKFDHNIHNAINQVEDESKESGDIHQVYQKGYIYKDRVLRPAMVVVVK